MLIGGKAFKVIDLERRTVQHDGYLMALVSRLGIDRMAPADDEDAAAFALRVLHRIIEQGAAAELAAAFLLPVDLTETDWTPAHTPRAVQHRRGSDRGLPHLRGAGPRFFSATAALTGDFPELFGGRGQSRKSRGCLDAGHWSDLVLEVAAFDHDRARAVLRWPVRHLLLAAVAVLKRTAREAYQFELTLWALTAPHADKKIDPPQLPDILKEP